MNITGPQLTQICPGLKGVYANVVAEKLSTICPAYGIDSYDIFHEFIANLLVECAEFTRFEENLNYSVIRLTQVWPSRFTSLAVAKQYAYQKEKLANFVYGGRRDLGNTHNGDGWLFRGSGPIQTTGRGNISAFTIYYNKKFSTAFTAAQMPELLRKDLAMGIHSACWFFAIAKDLIQLAIDDQMQTVCKRINGGYHGLDARLKYYERAKSVLQ
jgi:putative chitinase